MNTKNDDLSINMALFGISSLITYIGTRCIIEKDTKVTFCKEISTNHITIYKAPNLDDYVSNRKRTEFKKYYAVSLKKFIKCIKKNLPHVSLNIFNNNYKTLCFKEHDKRIKGSRKNVIGNYVQEETLINLLKEDKTRSVYHELLHSASTYIENNILYSGFKQTRLNRGGYSIGEAFNEGYTALLEERFFSDYVIKQSGYTLEKTIVSLFEIIIGQKGLEILYFNADLYTLVESVKLFKEESSFLEFLRRMDYIKNIRSKSFRTPKEIKYSLECLEYIGYFLLDLYMKVYLDRFKNKEKLWEEDVLMMKSVFNSYALLLETEVYLFGNKYKILSRDKSNNYIENFISSLDIKKLEKRI